ncbi:CU044_2847 family protein [Micromonospora sp. NPDC048170]|uniref:CU044_2847 family protein n=1 Tax=Micromonospora sp. NPDC048170 TaxID=3154819 RepID=UPI0033E8E3E8
MLVIAKTARHHIMIAGPALPSTPGATTAVVRNSSVPRRLTCADLRISTADRLAGPGETRASRTTVETCDPERIQKTSRLLAFVDNASFGHRMPSKGFYKVAFYVEVPLPDGSVVLAEVTEQVEGVVSAGRVSDVVGRVTEPFEESFARFRLMAAGVVREAWNQTHSPERVAVELGVKVTAKGKLVLAETGVEGQLKVLFEWQRSEVTPRGSADDE